MPEATNSPFTCKVRSHGWVAWACKVTVFPRVSNTEEPLGDVSATSNEPSDTL